MGFGGRPIRLELPNCAGQIGLLDIMPGKPMQKNHMEGLSCQICEKVPNETQHFRVAHTGQAIAERVEEENVGPPPRSVPQHSDTRRLRGQALRKMGSVLRYTMVPRFGLLLCPAVGAFNRFRH